jgi:hypothetical protein
MSLLHGAARQRLIAGADLLQDLVAARLGKCPGDSRELAIGEGDAFFGNHLSG